MSRRLTKLRNWAWLNNKLYGADVQVEPADYRERHFGRWWRIRGRFNVYVQGRCCVTPLRYHKAAWWVATLAERYADSALDRTGAMQASTEEALQHGLRWWSHG